MFVSSNIYGQTLFESPNTKPNYKSAYQNIEDCWQVGLRIALANSRTPADSIWQDTLLEETKEKIGLTLTHDHSRLKRRPAPAIDTINVCLEKFNADTVKVTSLNKVMRVIRILLVAHRDEDADRFAQRFLDSMQKGAQTSTDPIVRKTMTRDYKVALSQMMREYTRADPVRYDVVKNYYNRYVPEIAKDSGYYRIDAAFALMQGAAAGGDTSTVSKMMALALLINDSTPEEERLNSPGSDVRLLALANYVTRLTQQEGLDSLAISNVAYNLWRGNTVKRRVYGGEIMTREEAQPKKIPELVGAFYYVADNMDPDPVRKGMAAYTHKGAVPKGEVPLKNRINYFRSMPSFCHTQTVARSTETQEFQRSAPMCFKFAIELRQLKKNNPEIEIVGLAATYGTVGQVGPLTSAQEADTLAKMYLGFYHIPARLVVETVEFFHLPAPDGRRIDVGPTENSRALGFDVMNSYAVNVLTDKEGYRLYPPTGVSQAWFRRFIEILRDRPVQN